MCSACQQPGHPTARPRSSPGLTWWLRPYPARSTISNLKRRARDNCWRQHSLPTSTLPCSSTTRDPRPAPLTNPRPSPHANTNALQPPDGACR